MIAYPLPRFFLALPHTTKPEKVYRVLYPIPLFFLALLHTTKPEKVYSVLYPIPCFFLTLRMYYNETPLPRFFLALLQRNPKTPKYRRWRTFPPSWTKCWRGSRSSRTWAWCATPLVPVWWTSRGRTWRRAGCTGRTWCSARRSSSPWTALM